MLTKPNPKKSSTQTPNYLVRCYLFLVCVGIATVSAHIISTTPNNFSTMGNETKKKKKLPLSQMNQTALLFCMKWRTF